MNGFLQKLVSPRLRRIPATLCLLVLAMQVSMPVLHGSHATGPASIAGADTPVVQAAAEHGSAHAEHDAASCPQCRLVSQLRTLSPMSVLTVMPVLCTASIAAPALTITDSLEERDSGAPRAPPLPA